MNVTIETDRLIIRPVIVTDAEAVYKWASDPEVTKYLLYTTHPNIECTRDWLSSRDIEDEDSYDLGFVYKETGELIGMGGLVYSPKEDVWNIGYNLRKDFWGKGIVPEAMEGIIDTIQKNRKIRAISGEFAVENTKSGRVMEKLGMHFLRRSQYTKFDGTATYESNIYIKEF